MIELGLTLLAGGLAGLAVARWWIVPVPLALVLAWTAVTAAGGGSNSDGESNWMLVGFVGGLFAFAAATGLAIGVVWGRYLRDRRAERKPRAG